MDELQEALRQFAKQILEDQSHEKDIEQLEQDMLEYHNILSDLIGKTCHVCGEEIEHAHDDLALCGDEACVNAFAGRQYQVGGLQLHLKEGALGRDMEQHHGVTHKQVKEHHIPVKSLRYLKAHGTPLERKRANFALVARTWHHTGRRPRRYNR